MKTLKLAVLSGILAGAAFGGTITYNGTGATNVDTDPETVINLNIPDSGTILDVNLIISLSPNYADNVDIFLFHNGVLVHVYNAGGDTEEAFIDATFDDSADGPPPASGTVTGTVQSFQLLSLFNGLDVNGDWELRLLDDTAFPDDGTELTSWSLVVTTADGNIPEPASFALMGVGLLGLGLAARRRKKA